MCLKIRLVAGIYRINCTAKKPYFLYTIKLLIFNPNRKACLTRVDGIKCGEYNS